MVTASTGLPTSRRLSAVSTAPTSCWDHDFSGEARGMPFRAAGAWENLLLLVVLGGIGYMLKRHHWPRPPFVIGVILGPIAEDSLLKSLAIGGPAYFLRPISLVLMFMIFASIAFYIWRSRKPRTLVLIDEH
jgi:TctA family transporter